ncbi:MAG: hypothetical protein PHE27_02000 [Alphaproteobacteria bacterium]|nr:hypothetical protein [Alphaproteobacteria bacterium]
MIDSDTKNDTQYNLYHLQKIYVPEMERLGYGRGDASLAVRSAFRQADFETTFARGIVGGGLVAAGVFLCIARPLLSVASNIPSLAASPAFALAIGVLPAAAGLLVLDRARKRGSKYPVFSRQLDLSRDDPVVAEMQKKTVTTGNILRADVGWLETTGNAADICSALHAERTAAVRPGAVGSPTVFGKADRFLSRKYDLARKTRGWLFPTLK